MRRGIYQSGAARRSLAGRGTRNIHQHGRVGLDVVYQFIMLDATIDTTQVELSRRV